MMKTAKLLLITSILLIQACGNTAYIDKLPPLPPIQPANNCSCQNQQKQQVPPQQLLPVPEVSAMPAPQNNSGEVQHKTSQEVKVKQLYQKMLDSLAGIESYKTKVYNYVKGNYYKKKPIAEAKSSITENKVIFQRPRRMFLNIVSSSDTPSINNTRVYFDGSEKMKLKVPGLLGLFTFTFAVDKPELSNYRGYTAQDIDTVSLEQRLKNDNAQVKLTGISEVFGEAVYVLEVTGIETLDPEITKEVLGLRKTDLIPILHEMYAGTEMVYQNKFEGFELNVPVSEQDFKF